MSLASLSICLFVNRTRQKASTSPLMFHVLKYAGPRDSSSLHPPRLVATPITNVEPGQSLTLIQSSRSGQVCFAPAAHKMVRCISHPHSRRARLHQNCVVHALGHRLPYNPFQTPRTQVRRSRSSVARWIEPLFTHAQNDSDLVISGCGAGGMCRGDVPIPRTCVADPRTCAAPARYRNKVELWRRAASVACSPAMHHEESEPDRASCDVSTRSFNPHQHPPRL